MPRTLPPSDLPKVKASPRGVTRLKSGHVWVYRSDIEAWPAPSDAIPAGLVPITDRRGSLLGTGLYSPASEIALRLVSTRELDVAGDEIVAAADVLGLRVA